MIIPPTMGTEHASLPATARSRRAGALQAGAPGQGSAGSPRYEWMDAGRGVAIVLVVLLHATDWLQGAGVPVAGWETLNDVLSGVRMPLFFTISGMLGARWIRARWPDLASRKITTLFWVYLIWQPIGLGAAAMADQITGDHQSLLHWAVALVATVGRPRSELWFLWALSVYFALARLTYRRRLWPQLVAAGAVSALTLCTPISSGTLGWNGPPKYYLFFLLGAHCRTPLLWFAQRVHRSVGMLLGLIVTWIAAASASQALGGERFVGPGLATRSLGLAAGIALAGLLARRRLLSFLGSRTLPIYLAHTPLIITMAILVHAQRDTAWVHALTPVLPVLLTVATIPLTLLLHLLLRATPARVLYKPPERVTALVQRVCSSPRRARRAASLRPTGPPLPRLDLDPAPVTPSAATPGPRSAVAPGGYIDLTGPTGTWPVGEFPRTGVGALVRLGATAGTPVPVGVLDPRRDAAPVHPQADGERLGRRPSPYATDLPRHPPYPQAQSPAAHPRTQDPAAPAPRRPRHRADG